ncbi:hypothetical protein MANES_03G063225v8 [Manihot esculenta]|uniref:Uncharacterized protein n=1 Tax=Manihot esculenta TaxID=3983 RepID=A0ACB7HYW9_MANES|nr:hypothetical protein MANES_03G063225v8 [Manihot esculenta]
MEYCIAIGSAVAGEIAKTLLAPITGSIGHLFSCNTDIKKLEKELKKLVDKKATEVDPRVREAERNLEIISVSVIWWQKEVDDISQKGKEFLENDIEVIGKCFNGHCPDPKLRYSLSRKAKKMTKKVLALLQEAAKFGEIAHPGPPAKIGSIFITEGIRDFESRESIKNEVWEALKDDKLTMISICGTGGVGKTTMVKKLVQRIEREKLFDEVVMAVVSQTPNIKKIQYDIASCLSLKLCDESELTSAGKLRQRFINCGKRILLILDDVWSELDFERIGLPPRGERKGHTIMLTSRNKDVCNKLGSEKNFPMDVLTNEEAWDLFEEIASISIDQDLHHTATEIANECGGLPIAIVTVAKALKNKMRNIWDDALQQLKNSNLQGVSGDAFSKIELSYKFLEHEEAKLCFLLCSLFPEDFNIRVEDLVRYGMGLRLFKNVDNVHQARDRVYALIYELKESFLLLEGDHKWYDSVKMHDIVRDVAISIASRDKQWYMLQTDARIKEWQEKAGYKNCTAISLVCEKIIERPNDFECPKLELLQLSYDCQSQSLPNNIFGGMKELKVLALALGIPSLPPSLDVLKNLRTLHLEKFDSEEMHTIGTLVKLEILEIATCYLHELPGEIGLLKNLRLLDLRGVINLRYIPPGLLLGLSRLEELYVTDKFMMKWQSKEDGKKTNASLSELETHHITALEITVPKASILPKDLVFRNLIRFKIFIGHKFAYGSLIDRDSVNVLHLEGDASDIKGTEICAWLMRKAEVLNLIEVQNLKKVLYELEDYDFPDMKRTPFHECVGQEFLVDALEIVPRSREIQLSYFRNLREVNIRSCGKLKYFIPVSMARGLSQLHRILIAGCQEMEAVFHKTEADDEIEFLELVALKLDHLPKFLGFVINPSLTSKDMEQPGTSQMDNRTETKYPQNQERTGLVEMISTLFSSLCPRLPNLQELNLHSCGLLKIVFPPSVAQQLVQLKKLIIRGCPEMEYIVAEPQEEEKNKRISKIVFPNLILLDFHELPKLVAFCPDSHISFDWLSLKELTLICCPEMKTICATIPGSSALNKSFDQSDIIGGKKIMPRGGLFNQALVRRGREQQNFSSRKDIYQPGTFQMNNENLHSSIEPVDMISIFLPSNRLRLQNLQMLHLGGCDSVKVIFPPSVAQQLVQLQYLNIRMCSAMEYIVAETEEQEKNKGTNKIVFPNLSLIELVRLPKLVAFCPDVHVSFACPLLKRLNLYSCPNMKTLCFAIPSSTVLNGSVDHIPSNNGLDGKPIRSSIVRGVLRRGREQKYVSRNEVFRITNHLEYRSTHGKDMLHHYYSLFK